MDGQGMASLIYALGLHRTNEHFPVLAENEHRKY